MFSIREYALNKNAKYSQNGTCLFLRTLWLFSYMKLVKLRTLRVLIYRNGLSKNTPRSHIQKWLIQEHPRSHIQKLAKLRTAGLPHIKASRYQSQTESVGFEQALPASTDRLPSGVSGSSPFRSAFRSPSHARLASSATGGASAKSPTARRCALTPHPSALRAATFPSRGRLGSVKRICPRRQIVIR